MVRTQCFHSRGPGFYPAWRAKIPQSMSGKKRTCLLQIVNLNSYRNEPNTVGKLLIILRAEKKIKSKETEKILGNTDTY